MRNNNFRGDYMSIMMIEDQLITDNLEVLENQFTGHCEWCWGHGYGNCDNCKRLYHKYYIPLKIAELQKKNNLPVTREPKNKTER